jgi:hypothetical protein
VEDNKRPTITADVINSTTRKQSLPVFSRESAISIAC